VFNFPVHSAEDDSKELDLLLMVCKQQEDRKLYVALICTTLLHNENWPIKFKLFYVIDTAIGYRVTTKRSTNLESRTPETGQK